MKKVTFNVTSPKENSTSEVLKALNSLNCRLTVDFEKGIMTAECADDADLDAIIDLVDTNYTVSSIAVDNMEQGDVPQLENVPVNVSEMQNSNENKTLMNFPSLSEADNLLLNGRFEKLLKTASYGIDKDKLSATTLNKFITSITTEISRYSATTPDVLSVSAGDVITCYYGHHLRGEISGAYTQAIVYETCNRRNRIVRLLPLVAKDKAYNSNVTLNFSVPRDIEFYPSANVANRNGGTVMVDRIDWVSLFRIREVVGKASPDFMRTLRLMLKASFTSDEDIQPAKEAPDLSELLPSSEPSPKPQAKPEAKVETMSEAVAEPEEKPETKSKAKPEDKSKPDQKQKSDPETSEEVPQAKAKSGSIGEILYEHLSPIVDEIKPDCSLRGKAIEFMRAIGFSAEEIYLDAFEIACGLDKITYNNLLAKLMLMNKKYSEVEIKKELHDAFEIWLYTMPELAKDLPPRAAITDLLKFFVKYVGTPQN